MRKSAIRTQRQTVLYRSTWLVGALAGVVATSCWGNREGDEQTEPVGRSSQQASAIVSARPFTHPLLPEKWAALGLQGVPFRDTQTGPNGGALSVQYRYQEDENGDVLATSDLVELEQRMLTPDELAEMRKSKVAQTNAAPSPVVPPDVVSIAKDPARHIFSVSLRRDDVEQVVDSVNRDIALGLVRSGTDLATARTRALDARRTVLRQRQAPVAADVQALGGKVVALCESLFCMTVEMTAAQVADLASRNRDVVRVDLDRIGSTETGDAGAAIAGGSQITPMLLGGWDGAGQIMRVPIAQLEAWTGSDNCGLNPTHPGFNDTSSADSRVASLVACDGTSCSTQSVSYWAANYKGLHATGVANLLIGDLTDGQDPVITDGNDRFDKSGYSQEAFLAYAMCVLPYSGAFSKAADYLVGQSIGALVVNMSAKMGDDDQCLGQNTESRKVNDIFEDGQLVFKSAGNTAGSATNCTVTSPGSAIGAFTVGAIGPSSPVAITPNDVRTKEIASYSAFGGGSTEGGNRTIIDLTAYGCRKELFDLSGGYTYSNCGTSFAAPTVAAAAANFSEFFTTTYGYGYTFPSPGTLFVNMLLMGDRQAQGGVTMTTDFDPLWGGGRLRVRTFDTPGLDAPAEYLTGYVCVGNHSTVTVSLNAGAAIPATANALKAALYWYDSRHELGTTIDDIDLKLRNTGTGTILARSQSSYDEKERIYYANPGGLGLALDIYGYNVTADGAGCGTDSMEVYYAVFWEDSARDDAEGPTNSGSGTGFTDVVPE